MGRPTALETPTLRSLVRRDSGIPATELGKSISVGKAKRSGTPSPSLQRISSSLCHLPRSQSPPFPALRSHLSSAAALLWLSLSLAPLLSAPPWPLATAAPSGPCKSGLHCEHGGVCLQRTSGAEFCQCPPPESALQPDFFVGARCHIPAVMCSDTHSFYCAYASKCVEIVQGENYSCEGCNAAVSGPHCDAEGVPCGSHGLSCFNGGTCSPAGPTCLCPSEWSGNENCTAPGVGQGERDTWRDEEQTWYVPVLGAAGALAVLSILGILIFFCYPKQSTTALSERKDSDETLGLQEHNVARDGANDDSENNLELTRSIHRTPSHEPDPL